MNIAYILHRTTSLGGGTKSFMQMLGGLMKKGIHPYVIMPDSDGIYQDIKEMGIPIFVTRFRNSAYPDVPTWKDYILFFPKLLARIYLNQKASTKVAVYLKDKNIDIIHTNVSVSNIGYRASRILRIPHIYHIREYGDTDFNVHYFPTRKSFLKKLAEEDSYSIFITKDIQRHFGLQRNASSQVIYNGILPKSAGIPESGKKPFFLYAGRVIPAKGLYELLTAYKIYREQTSSPYPLYVSGDTDDTIYYKKITHYMTDNNLGGSIKFLGVRKDLYALMQQAIALIIPSHSEGFGRCMAEAMFNGCLSIGRNTGGTKEQLDNGLRLTGKEIALRFDSTEQLVECLKHAECMSREEKDGYIERAFHTVNTLYSVESNVDEVLKFYNRIIG